jgi:hypothetical protein
MGQYGNLVTDRKRYQPLDAVTVTITGRAKGDTRCTIRVCDTDLREYFVGDVELVDNTGEITFLAAGSLGVHWVYLYFPDEEKHQRYVNFVLDADTTIESGDDMFDELYPFTKDALALSRRVFHTEEGKFVGYISGDTWNLNGVWLRDWIYYFPAYCNWETEMTCGLDRFLDKQGDDGIIPDGIRRDGSTWRMAVESDVEYIFVLGVWLTWRTTGDNEWMGRMLPKLEKALDYIRNDESRWDDEHNLVKRGHTCDTWDFEIGETADFQGKRHVVATCDQSGYEQAFRAMADMYDALGDNAHAEEHRTEAAAYRQRASDLLWDGVKFQHHHHLTPIEHGDFDETEQLAMGNVWAVTRGLATHEQAVSVISEYRRRHATTGDKFPWWSLQPGYPDELGYYPGAHCQQGGYANGGLMPWVGGELCRGAFLHGMEAYGLELLKQYIDHLRETGGAHVWYWPNGEPGFRTTNEVPNTGWGMSEWIGALLEGLAGIRDVSGVMREVELSPRWAVTDNDNVRAIQRYAVNDAYIAYRLILHTQTRCISLRYTGSGEQVGFNLLLPDGWTVDAVQVNGEVVDFDTHTVEESRYIRFRGNISGLGTVRIDCE